MKKEKVINVLKFISYVLTAIIGALGGNLIN